MSNLPSLLTKTPRGSETASLKSATLASATSIGDNFGLDDKPNSVKSHDSVKSNRNRIKRKQPGSNLGSVSSIATKGSDNHTPPSADGTFEDSEAGTGRSAQEIHYHGSVQTDISMFRKKKEYLVLTETHLFRFRDLSEAIKSFPQINPRQHSIPQRHGSTPSFGSMHDLQTLSSRSSLEHENKNSIPLQHIVATYRVEDGRPFFIVQVDYLDETSSLAAAGSSMQLMLHDPREADVWHTSIRGASQKAKLMTALLVPDRTVENVTGILEAALDYDSARMQIFYAVQLENKKAGKSTTEEVTKVNTSLCYLVFGATKLHIITIPDAQDLAKQKQYKSHKSSYGLVSLVAMEFKEHDDDVFELGFRLPMQPEVILRLASCQAHQIGTLIFQSIVYLKPQWLDYTFLYNGPHAVIDDPALDLQEVIRDESGCFDRTLIAYCQAYGCAPHNVRYDIRDDVEDAPQFVLLAPQESRAYSMHELLAIFRSLRYNNNFRSLSFADVSLESLNGVVDIHGTDHVASTSRGNNKAPINVISEGKSLLYQEVQALALKSFRLRRIDFTNTLPIRRSRAGAVGDESPSRDPKCDLVMALLPLCTAKLTEIDWIILNGVELSDSDMDDMLPILRVSDARLRAVEIARCGLSVQGITSFLVGLQNQNASIECINIADNMGRVDLDVVRDNLRSFSRIRILNLSRAITSVGGGSFIDLQVLISWKLEELILSGVAINKPSLETICGYLFYNNSNELNLLQLEGCSLSGSDVACLMASMVPEPGIARNLVLNVSSNKLEKGVEKIAQTISQNQTPVHLIMRMVEYHANPRFRQLLEALRHNTTIKILDMSKASLETDADTATCLTLQRVFEENDHLEELDISGEHAHLEVARFGIGLSDALIGLKNNKALRVLKIEYQQLGVEGTNALATVLLSNSTLTHIYCEHNDISLQSFTILVSCLEKNYSIVHMPLMEADKNVCLKQMYGKLTESRSVPNTDSKTKQAFRKTSGLLKVNHKQSQLTPTPQDISHAIDQMNKRWQIQRTKMIEFLERNMIIAQQGREAAAAAAAQQLQDDRDLEELMRPNTADSETYIIEAAMNTTTPRYERNNPHDIQGSGARTMTQSRFDSSSHNFEGDGSPRREGTDYLGWQRRESNGSELTERMSRFGIGPE